MALCDPGPERSATESGDGGEEEDGHTVVNWSGTHQVTTGRYFEPETTAELEALVAAAHASGERLRPLGSALSPNGLAFSSGGMVGLSQLDRVIHVDKEKKQVTVEAGARVAQVVEAIREHGLTLQNFASIAEQQVGGFVSVGAHGTGAAIPPVDEQVVRLKLVTPAEGTVTLDAETDPLAFKMARVGLGALGVISEVTLQCVDNHKLREDTFVLTRKQIRARHQTLLAAYKHVRYMWIPYTESVVVVGSNPCAWAGEDEDEDKKEDKGAARVMPPPPPPPPPAVYTEAERLAPLRQLLAHCRPEVPDVDGMGFSQLRDELLAAGTLDTDHVVAVNTAEAEFWRRSQGQRTDESLNILQFDCGGQQWVYEVVFPTGGPVGRGGTSDLRDIDYMERLLGRIESSGLPAPAPIEQRWTSSSSSPMSPASSSAAVDLARQSKTGSGGKGTTSDTGTSTGAGAGDGDSSDSLQCWIGIIMYIPTDDPAARLRIADRFKSYCALEGEQMPDFAAQVHWAKIEAPAADDAAAVEACRAQLKRRFPVETFNALRDRFDPKRVLSNGLLDTLLETAAR